MHNNCSPFLSAPPCHFLSALGMEGFLLSDREGPEPASERISGKQDAHEAKASLFLGVSPPLPQIGGHLSQTLGVPGPISQEWSLQRKQGSNAECRSGV